MNLLLSSVNSALMIPLSQKLVYQSCICCRTLASNASTMNVFDRQHQLSCIKFSLLLLEHITQNQQIHEVSACQILHYQIEVGLILERIKEVAM